MTKFPTPAGDAASSTRLVSSSSDSESLSVKSSTYPSLLSIHRMSLSNVWFCRSRSSSTRPSSITACSAPGSLRWISRQTTAGVVSVSLVSRELFALFCSSGDSEYIK
eukprot:Gregarina_sp_Poly_1__3450@NODE_19_length_21533_cov_161_091167_g17_i0_p18_GENE_NODE_19_length_21533_cov_161_091167_g17_i0NODE_19_length_21533_cov_161_091167_g17_i0_p18_ORF_typecomplete_len108_score9_97_NODE_19_length_21533_cov_161_091167_g17_i01787218195